ncbi:mannose-1-phosphate guanylyltransferase [Algibacter lectus]|uniref:mannose-1-phosphate guanylyltransferase n=1 Tax=Algibacter lectus TaxID=221126 RepID=A0A090WVG5_9FLAO|nr:mannose-1-phosphate guanylyltransferase [Algibacter lectus]MWW24917.1 mannose-1-phosphate guanylyltransferase [Algibacter lectus]TDY64672.1 mannose-1-phosphate guanylyltransferase [Algibacter lectus]SFD22812.1 mannose-1-phosphate guanylyltransferase [Algibacter lectus]GAL61374.1 mannose-1-phosphate guanylyltransferase [Algibacter lectus]GAL79384.1 mannose-1-phosphate guanylyltransferase [Algibacter lectus]
MKNNYYAILMAGGVGSRFWPVSTSDFPKQFHDMLGTGDTLIQKTFQRLSRLIPKENIYILTNERYNDLVLEQLPEVTQKQVVLEPAMRNTAPCILYASLKIQKENPDALMIVAPSDHWIEDEQTFSKNVEEAFNYCSENDALMTLGIQPTFPNTGFGYIEFDKNSENVIKPVSQFREKPDYETAKAFISQGNFLWNAGIFMWSAKSVVDAFKNNQPELYQLFESGISVYNTDGEDDFIKENYSKAENISVDYAIMEKSKNVFVIGAEFDWNDLGTWGSLYDKLDKDSNNNAILNANSLVENAEGNMIRTKLGKQVIVDGLNDYIIVDNDEALLIYPKSKEQDIKLVLKRLNDKYSN